MWLYNIFRYLKTCFKLHFQRQKLTSLYVYIKRRQGGPIFDLCKPCFYVLFHRPVDLFSYSFHFDCPERKTNMSVGGPTCLVISQTPVCSAPYVTPGRLGSSAHPTGPRNHWDSMKSVPPSLISSCVSTHSHTQQRGVT